MVQIYGFACFEVPNEAVKQAQMLELVLKLEASEAAEVLLGLLRPLLQSLQD